MNPKNNITFDTSAKLTQFLMKCIGLSLEAFTPELEKNGRSWWKISQGTLFFLSYLLLFLTALGEAAYFRQSLINYKGFLDVTAVAPCIGFCFLSLIKMLTVSFNSKTLSRMHTELRNMFPNDGENDIVVESMKKSHKNMLQFVIPNMIFMLCFNSIPLIMMSAQYFKGQEITLSLPYLIWYPIDVYVMPLYIFIYAFQVWASIVAIGGILAADCPFSLYTAHVCMHFRLLAQKMRTLTSKSEHRLLDLEDLRPCIEEHQKLIDGEIAWAAYDSPWTDASMKYKKSLQFIILRAQRQQTYTAMKFSTVSFESFASVLKASFSYFTLLRTVFSKD
ncbi:putative odorant receptor 92a [Ctenocephalides felis]|uniref:putative odorant receptor 92a n=1 Tax=Ctenocephalides felis TaxID=7515 RepID=UPI000E6E27DD|nr:putative odorant receptor 92a [Ctenocephalides felis]